MYDVIELEQKWQIYNGAKRKKYYIFSAILFTVAIIVIGIAYGLGQAHKENINNLDAKADTPIVISSSVPSEFNVSAITKPSSVLVLNLQEPSGLQNEQENSLQNEIKLEPTKNSALDVLQMRFKESPTYKNAIDLANAYYSAQEYENARNYAIAANTKDPDKDEGWIVFAKASVKLGKRQDAITALQKFNQNGGTSVTKELEKELKGQK